jgi:hypothetical protein
VSDQADQQDNDTPADAAATSCKEMNLYLRGGQTVTVLVKEATISRLPLTQELSRLEWTGVGDPTELRLREIRLEAVDAITFRDVAAPTGTGEAGRG